jgi:hypothetical protein
MMRRLLAAAAEGGIGNLHDLALRLGISPALVQLMLGELSRRGYVRPAGECAPACGGCSLRSACHAGPQRRTAGLWVLTEAGRRAAQS